MAQNGLGPETTYKILVLGDSNVGKTCLIHRFCDQAFHDHYISTIGIDCKQKIITLHDKEVRLRIWDTAGQERFRTLTSAYYRGAQGIVLVYDITRMETFEHLAYWMKNISVMASSDIGKILVGNKCDLESERVVNMEKAQQFAETFDVDHVETSCKLDSNVAKVFTTLAEHIYRVQDQTNLLRTNGLQDSLKLTPIDHNNDKTNCAC